MKIGIDMGHTLSGAGTGAIGYVKETDRNRDVGRRLIQMLESNGHEIVNCTVDKSSNDLRDRAAKANAQKLDIFVSLHLNAYKKTNSEMGVETFSYPGSSVSKGYAVKVQNALVSKVGWRNRGAKEANFYVLRETSCPAILVELGFCDSKGDLNKWDTEKICSAIFLGLTGKEYVQPKKKAAYRVVCGSYAEIENAKKQVSELEKLGLKPFIVAIED